MGIQVVAGATMTCSFGVAPAVLVPIPNMVMASNLPTATITDSAPMVNIPTFGMCNTITNPVVAAATAAKLGVFSPAPCIPATVAPWAPGAIATKIGGKPALTDSCKCMCTWGGVITITNPGQMAVQAS